MSDELREHITDSNIWMRLVFMLLFAVIFGATRLILVLAVAVQFLWVLFSGNKNEQLLSFSSQLATYLYQAYRYLTFNTEKRPFPFDAWPSDAALIDDAVAEPDVDEEPAARAKEKKEPEVIKAAEEETPEIDDAADVASESGIEIEESKK
ncbi:protein of unknown function (DUF4389) [Mariprofundus ferrinatatus]|uniref:DUF4389 domain-containing protein n=1 Tax=Mariprofundus ferrinatatus TaxID=1921087 RepID=A0A2K8LAS5_9PROT|nr:DUF4389 domain-containing protein [Mariprofundus ferrinatatus]ATX81356.1 protein of unknown function (DUF4389) [Mariprofundus ferrinatatus]